MIRRLHLFLLSILLLAGAHGARAAGAAPVLRFCSIDIDFAPVARADFSGHYQYLLLLAARKAGVGIERKIAPRRRCLDDIRAGISDGMIGAYSPERLAIAVFPMSEGEPDVSKSFGTVRYYPYRRTGSGAVWDGQRFHGLEGSVGVESAFAFVTDRLRALGVPYDDGAKTLEQNMDKLPAERVDPMRGKPRRSRRGQERGRHSRSFY